MEHIETSIVTSVLTEALNRYLKYLQLELELHESSQPRQGKGVETNADIARAQYFHARTVATQSCLLVVRRIAETVKQFVVREEEVELDEREARSEKEAEAGHGFGSRDDSLIDFDEEIAPSIGYDLRTPWEEEDDEPYINPLTGQWIIPTTSKSAGPSNSHGLDEVSRRRRSIDSTLRANLGLLPPIVEVRRTVVPDLLMDFGDINSIGAQSKENALDSFRPSSNTIPSLLDLDNDSPPPYEVLIPKATNSFVNTTSSRQSSSSPGISTPKTSSRDTNLELEDTVSSWNDERETAAIRQPTWESDDRTQNQYELDRLAAQKFQTQLDAQVRESENYARQLESEEKTHVLDLDAEMEAARRLASQWEAEDGLNVQSLKSLQERWDREDRMLEEQVALAEEMRRSDEARQAAIRRDQTAAREAQERWEREAREAEEGTRRIIEEMEREEERERERMRIQLEEAKRLAEDLERQEEEERQRLAAEAAEAERRERQADCVVCMEASDKVNMCLLGCEHYYCGECITAAFNTALTSRAPFKCCNRNVLASTAARFLSAQVVPRYDLMVLELSTPNPRYCSAPNCRIFIPPNSVHGPVAICPSCHTRTCASCNNAEHAGVCAEDRDGAAVVALAKSQGWKTCPSCRAILERTEGCLHMTCRCGAEWCYNCLGNWKNCRSTCSRA